MEQRIALSVYCPIEESSFFGGSRAAGREVEQEYVEATIKRCCVKGGVAEQGLVPGRPDQSLIESEGCEQREAASGGLHIAKSGRGCSVATEAARPQGLQL